MLPDDSNLDAPNPVDGDIPMAIPVEFSAEDVPMAIPLAMPLELPEALPDAIAEAVPAVEAEVPVLAPPSVKVNCGVCGAPRDHEGPSCVECGYYFTEKDLEYSESNSTPLQGASLEQLIGGKYQVVKLERQISNVQVFEGVETEGEFKGRKVWIYLQPESPAERKPAPSTSGGVLSGPQSLADEFLPTFDDSLLSGAAGTPIGITKEMSPMLLWPNIGWLRSTLDCADNAVLPKVITSGKEGGSVYLILENPEGKNLWEVWDDEKYTLRDKFGFLKDLAGAMKSLHGCSAFLEFIRPESVVFDANEKLCLKDVLELLPLPLPPGGGVRGTLYTPPELLSGKGCVSARAALYSFGALIYSLEILHRELSETDFEKPGVPKSFLGQFPDVHPAFGRLITKTFTQEIEYRFPTDEARRLDATGFQELMETLESVGRQMEQTRIEIASWTNTGMIRSGNEDAFALLHSSESRQEDLSDTALLLVADGMGGYEAGEVAAAMTMEILREFLTAIPMFGYLAGKSRFPAGAENPPQKGTSHLPGDLDVDACKQNIRAGLKEANRRVFTASRVPGANRRGMGCTAEAVYIDGKNLVAGHVGDSRVYHLRRGELVQVTRDQTLVNRLVELGTITAEEAETHPRKNELQQAIGGQPDVEVGLYHAVLSPGDWVIVCSDGLTNHVSNKDLRFMLANEAVSAQMAARRLVNLANIHGATDNATVVVVRCT